MQQIDGSLHQVKSINLCVDQLNVKDFERYTNIFHLLKLFGIIKRTYIES
jgi:hypothetical protein